jgi:hypothetical protein
LNAGGLIEDDAWRAGLLVAQEVFSNVPVGDDFGRLDERLVRAGVVGVVVRVQRRRRARLSEPPRSVHVHSA